MHYRFHVLASIIIMVAMTGVAQARDYSGVWSVERPSARLAQHPILSPVPDSQSDPGSVANEGMTAAPIVTEGHPSSCDCGYCSSNTYSGAEFNTACGSYGGKIDSFLLRTKQCYDGLPDSPYLHHKGQFVIESWLDQGFTWNSANPTNNSNLPLTFTDRANEYQMNQLYLVMQRKLDQRKQWDWGARLDLLYGSDYVYTQAIGLETRRNGNNKWNGPGPRETFGGPGGAALYGLSMPQVYAELLMPVAYGTTIKAGHFYSIMGHESVMAPENFFYSHSYTTQYAEPFTHTGVLLDYRYRPNFSVKAGVVRGWDAWEDPMVGNQSVQRIGFLGGISWQSCDERTALDFTLYTGNEQFGFFDNQLQNRTNYSLVLKRDITSRLTYVLQHDLGIQQKGSFVRQGEIPTHWYTVVNYLYYKMNEETSIGCRLEWFNDPQISRVLALPTPDGSTGGSYYEATVGLNWKPFERCVIRPELRWDWSDVTPQGRQGAYNQFQDKNQFTLGVDVLYRF